MITHAIIDNLTWLSAAYTKRFKPRLNRFKAVPGGRFVIKLPRKLLDGATSAIGVFSSVSPDIKALKNRVSEIQVAQIGGTTRTFFDEAPHLVKFNTHDWRSDENSRESSNYVKIEGGTSLPWQDAAFDVVASRHALEHISNPIAAIKEWERVLKPGGLLYISLPDRRKTPEHVRELTSLQHFIDDHENNVPEFDPTHEEEITRTGVGIVNHDIYEIPYIHFHTFEPRNLRELVQHCGFDIVELSVGDLHLFRHKPWDLILLARKPDAG